MRIKLKSVWILEPQTTAIQDPRLLFLVEVVEVTVEGKVVVIVNVVIAVVVVVVVVIVAAFVVSVEVVFVVVVEALY